LIKGFFFDLDGTLVDTYRADFLAYRDAVKDVLDKELDEAAYAALHGMEIAAKLASLFPGVDPASIDKIRSVKKQAYLQYLNLTSLNVELVSFLKQLSRHHMCVLVTTAKKDNVSAILNHHGLDKLFEFIVSGDDVTRHKPDSEAYEIALQKSGLQPDQVLAFEDSKSGLESAEAAGISVVHIREFSTT